VSWPVTTLERVGAFVPARSVAVDDVADSLGLGRYAARIFRRFHGLDQLREDPEANVFDLVVASARAVLREVADPATIRYLLFAHTIPDVTPSTIDAAEVIASRLGLAGAEAFAVTQQNCASGLAAIDIAGELLRAGDDPRARALVVTGEKAFTPVTRFIAGTTIMGEASSACVVSVGGETNTVRSYVARTRGQFADGIRLSPEALKAFNDSYAEELTAVIDAAVQAAGLTLPDIEMVVPHNVNRLLWLRIIGQLGLDPKRIYLDTIAKYSHCWCSDPLLNLASLQAEDRLVKGGCYLLTSVGLGSTYSAMVVEH
jgi:3-oxoacyl-[acyl-carrier-protein] synthase III